MPFIPPEIPFVFDRALGNSFGGTPTPDGVATAFDATQESQNTSTSQIAIFEELPDSPQLEFGEHATIVHRFHIDPQQAFYAAAIYTRGSTWLDSAGNLCRVLNVRFDAQKGNYYIMAVTSEGLSFSVPPPEYDIQEIDINPVAQKHPRYAPLNQIFLDANNNPSGFNPIAVARQAVDQLNPVSGAPQLFAVNQLLNKNNFKTQAVPTGDLTAQSASLELLKKLRRGEETFYLAGYKVSFSTFSFEPQLLDPGGRIEDPVASGNLPPEFYLNGFSQNIFTELTSTLSPQFYGNGISWFRQADSQIFQRTWFRRTQTWIMAPAGGTIELFGDSYQWIGQWDLQWYTPLSPSNPSYPPYDTDYGT